MLVIILIGELFDFIVFLLNLFIREYFVIDLFSFLIVLNWYIKYVKLVYFVFEDIIFLFIIKVVEL